MRIKIENIIERALINTNDVSFNRNRFRCVYPNTFVFSQRFKPDTTSKNHELTVTYRKL